LQQRAARLAALHQQAQFVARGGGGVVQRLRHQRQHAQGGRQHEGAARERDRAPRCQLTDGLRMRRFVGLGKARRHPQPRVRGVVEGAADAQRGRVFQAGRLAEPRQRFVIAERGGGEDPGFRRRTALLAHRRADVQR
jgi:hypothetical protein